MNETNDTITEYQNLLAEAENVKERLREERVALIARLSDLDKILGSPKSETPSNSGKPKQKRAKLGIVKKAAEEWNLTPLLPSALKEFAIERGVKPESLRRAILVLRKKQANGD